jgi:hypothetical protein
VGLNYLLDLFLVLDGVALFLWLILFLSELLIEVLLLDHARLDQVLSVLLSVVPSDLLFLGDPLSELLQLILLVSLDLLLPLLLCLLNIFLLLSNPIYFILLLLELLVFLPLPLLFF